MGERIVRLLNWAGVILGILSLPSLIALYFTLERRDLQIETEVSKLNLKFEALAIARASDGKGSIETSGNQDKSPNEICAELARQVVDAEKNHRSLTLANPIRELMRDLGCIKR